MGLLQELLDEAGIGWGDLAEIACGVGPGNFTGVRISVASGRALALGLGVRCIGLSRLQAALHGRDWPCMAVMDARRGERYAERPGPGGFAPRLVPADEVTETDGVTVIDADADPEHLIDRMARLAVDLYGQALLPAKPMYLRPPVDVVPSDPAPVMLP
jgi:tRNA threonylcarbamoyl adenosine modification protein YeaZ